jgi:TusA-related sulfurtransferase
MSEQPVPAAMLNACGLTCGSLEAQMASRLRVLAPGEVLEVLSDRQEDADGVSAWIRLSGHALVAVEKDWSSRCARYFVRKKTSTT